MAEEREHPVLTSTGQDNEIRRLCDALDYFSGDVDFYPKGSCNWTIAQIHLKGVRDRLAELGIDEIHEVVLYESHDDGLGEIVTKKKLKVSDASRWLEAQGERKGKR